MPPPHSADTTLVQYPTRGRPAEPPPHTVGADVFHFLQIVAALQQSILRRSETGAALTAPSLAWPDRSTVKYLNGSNDKDRDDGRTRGGGL
jgi:hypothetical protein